MAFIRLGSLGFDVGDQLVKQHPYDEAVLKKLLPEVARMDFEQQVAEQQRGATLGYSGRLHGWTDDQFTVHIQLKTGEKYDVELDKLPDNAVQLAAAIKAGRINKRHHVIDEPALEEPVNVEPTKLDAEALDEVEQLFESIK